MSKQDICGIYGYYDNLKDKLVYVGQSYHIHYRHRDHYANSKYDGQVINRVLQNNKGRYDLVILKECPREELNHWEMTLIALFQPKFNFSIGGKFGLDNRNEHHGMWKHHLKNDLIKEFYLAGWDSTQMGDFFGVSRRTIERRLHKIFDDDFIKETRRKRQSKSAKGKVLSEETRKKISKANKGRKLTEKQIEAIKKRHTGKFVSEETRRKMSEGLMRKQVRLNKAGFSDGKQKYKLFYLNKPITESIYYYRVWLIFIALSIEEGFIDPKDYQQ